MYFKCKIKNILNFLLKYTKFRIGIKHIFTQIFSLKQTQIIGDTYANLWKFKDEIKFLGLAETSILYEGGDVKHNLIGYEKQSAYPQISIYGMLDAESSMLTGLPSVKRKFYFIDLINVRPHALSKFPLPVHQLDFDIFVSAERNYSHFITEDLYSILKIHELGYSFSIVIAEDSLWKKDIIKLFLPSMNFILVNKFSYVSSPYTYRLQRETRGYYHPMKINYLNNIFSSKTLSFDNNIGKSIYISRRFSDSRTFDNEESLEKTLDKYGFIILYCENLNFEEKLSYFRHAPIIVSPHGAGLTHLIACNDKTHLIELIDTDMYSFCFAMICDVLSIKYSSCEISRNINGKKTVNLENLIKLIDGLNYKI